MPDRDRTPTETAASELRRWLVENRDMGSASAGLVGPIANFVAGEQIIYRDAAIGPDADGAYAGRIVVFTDKLVVDAVVQPSGRNPQGDRVGVVSVAIISRTDLEKITTADEHIIGAGSFNRDAPQWPCPITATLSYKGGKTIPMPLEADRRYYSDWVTELLPGLLRDLDA